MEAKLNEILRKGGSKSPKDGRPIRPLSAYNIFFHMEKIARANNESGYTSGTFSSYVSAKWKKCSAALKIELEAMSKLDKERYNRENLEWKENMLKEAMESTEGAQTVKSHSFNKREDGTAVEAAASTNNSTLSSSELSCGSLLWDDCFSCGSCDNDDKFFDRLISGIHNPSI